MRFFIDTCIGKQELLAMEFRISGYNREQAVGRRDARRKNVCPPLELGVDIGRQQPKWRKRKGILGEQPRGKMEVRPPSPLVATNVLTCLKVFLYNPVHRDYRQDDITNHRQAQKGSLESQKFYKSFHRKRIMNRFVPSSRARIAIGWTGCG
jgi:hypothetical protein